MRAFHSPFFVHLTVHLGRPEIGEKCFGKVPRIPSGVAGRQFPGFVGIGIAIGIAIATGFGRIVPVHLPVAYGSPFEYLSLDSEIGLVHTAKPIG